MRRLFRRERVLIRCEWYCRKRLIGLVSVVAIVVTAGGCGGNGKDEEPEAGRPAVTYVGPSERFCDRTWRVQGSTGEISARLIVGRFEPGGDPGMSFRVENLGAEKLVHGSLPFIDRWVNGQWVPQRLINADGVEYGFSLKAFGVEPGGLGKCVWTPLPQGWPEGQYRLSFPVDTFSDRGDPPELILDAEFFLAH